MVKFLTSAESAEPSRSASAALSRSASATSPMRSFMESGALSDKLSSWLAAFLLPSGELFPETEELSIIESNLEHAPLGDNGPGVHADAPSSSAQDIVRVVNL